jgi:uncharacterized protein (TIGR00725 family)
MSVESTRVPVVAVIGSAGALEPAITALCHELGGALMAAGFRVVTGGCGGVMEAVAQGARQHPAWVEGRIVALLPSYRRSEANTFSDIVIPTGLQLARNVLVVASADVVIAIDGGAGTLSELALAWQLDRPVIALGSTGWAGRLAGEQLDHRSDQRLEAATSIDDAMRLCRSLLARTKEAGDIGSRWRT